MRYFLKAAGSDTFDEVDEYVFKQRAKVVLDDDAPRYADVWFTLEGHQVEFHGEFSATTLGRICRLLSVSIPTGTLPIGTFGEPQMVIMKDRGRLSLYNLQNGTVWKQDKKAA